MTQWFVLETKRSLAFVQSMPRRGLANQLSYALFNRRSNATRSCSVDSRTSGSACPSIDSCINWQQCEGNNRHRSLQRILFIVENERSTLAVPIGNNSNFLTTTENVGNIAHFSVETARSIRFFWSLRSVGRRRKIRHSASKSLAATFMTRAILSKLTTCRLTFT